MATITEFQNKLISDLKAEFERLNPIVTDKKVSNKFSVETIDNCLNEKKLFTESIKEYNRAMIKSLEKVFYSEINSFKKEFNKYFDVIIGTNYSSRIANTYDEVKDDVLNSGFIKEHNEVRFYITSKIKKSKDDDSKYTNGMASTLFYCHFKTEKSSVLLENGEVVEYKKIKGICFSNYDWIRQRDNTFNRINDTLFGLLNENKELQIRLTDLCKTA